MGAAPAGLLSPKGSPRAQRHVGRHGWPGGSIDASAVDDDVIVVSADDVEVEVEVELSSVGSAAASGDASAMQSTTLIMKSRGMSNLPILGWGAGGDIVLVLACEAGSGVPITSCRWGGTGGRAGRRRRSARPRRRLRRMPWRSGSPKDSTCWSPARGIRPAGQA